MGEPLPLYGPGFTISKDRFGNLVDVSGSLTEHFCLLGIGWNMATNYVTLVNALKFLAKGAATFCANVGVGYVSAA